MYRKKRLSMMIIAILMLQIILPVLSVVTESEITVISKAEDNTWDVSLNGDGSVIATLDENGLLKITGTGPMRNYNSSNTTPYSSVKGKIKTVQIEKGVTSIGRNAFSDCSSLTNITIPEGVTSISMSVFSGCSSLTNITIPESVTSIGNYAFSYCESLTSIQVNQNNSKYCSVEGVLYNKEKTEIIRYPAGKTSTEYIIPKVVTRIGNSAFQGCSNLTNITIPESVTSIGNYAFSYCGSLTNITIPEGVTSTGNRTFYHCSSLTSITIPESVTNIGTEAFYHCSSLTSITIPEGVTSIGSSAFESCSDLTGITIPESVTSIGKGVFLNCKLTIDISEGEETQEIMPQVLKRALDENDILHTGKAFSLSNCIMNEEGNKIKVNVSTASEKEVSILVEEGALEGLKTVIRVPSGTITYSTTQWTKENINAILHIAQEETITNNGGSNLHTFTQNGEFTYTYTTKEGTTKEVTARVNNIDRAMPTISKVTKSTDEWTREGVTLTITAQDEGSGLASKAYSFDGGQTWQEKNTKTYTENTKNIVIKVKDKLENIATYQTINIDNIDKEMPTISKVTKSTDEWTKEGVTLTITAQDEGSGLASKAYSFDGGQTWQEKNTKTYTENTKNVVIKVKDKANNIQTYQDTITIDNIVVHGDANGDGKVDFADIMAINVHRLNKGKKLEGQYLMAADVTGDGQADFSDIAKINLYRLKKISSI